MSEVSLSPFQKRVYAACSAIPEGKTSTYGALARAIGCGSSQAVGQALRNNPLAPMVPCHRVIAADRHLHGFGGKTDPEGLGKKRKLLEAEGVGFDAQGRVVKGDVLW